MSLHSPVAGLRLQLSPSAGSRVTEQAQCLRTVSSRFDQEACGRAGGFRPYCLASGACRKKAERGICLIIFRVSIGGRQFHGKAPARPCRGSSSSATETHWWPAIRLGLRCALDDRNDPDNQGNGQQNANDCPDKVASAHAASSVHSLPTTPLSPLATVSSMKSAKAFDRNL
jgi:hypothetical protein